MHRTTPNFWTCFARLPKDVQKSAKRKFSLLKANPDQPSLHFKKVGEFWSVRVNLAYRALAIEDDSDFIWFWVGKHDEYDRLIGS